MDFATAEKELKRTGVSKASHEAFAASLTRLLAQLSGLKSTGGPRQRHLKRIYSHLVSVGEGESLRHEVKRLSSLPLEVCSIAFGD